MPQLYIFRLPEPRFDGRKIDKGIVKQPQLKLLPQYPAHGFVNP